MKLILHDINTRFPCFLSVSNLGFGLKICCFNGNSSSPTITCGKLSVVPGSSFC